MIDNRLAPYGAFALRAALGIMFIAHAYLKIAVFTVPGFAGFLGQVGFPRFLAWPIILAELDRRPRHPDRLLCPPRLGRAAAGPARRPARPRPERLGVQRPERRLGISGLPGGRGRGPRPDRRRRLRREAGHPPGRPRRPRSARGSANSPRHGPGGAHLRRPPRPPSRRSLIGRTVQESGLGRLPPDQGHRRRRAACPPPRPSSASTTRPSSAASARSRRRSGPSSSSATAAATPSPRPARRWSPWRSGSTTTSPPSRARWPDGRSRPRASCA